MPRVARLLAMVSSSTGSPFSSTAPLVGMVSFWSKVAKSNRCPSTKTLPTMSPPPPGIPNGALWQPAQPLESGAEMRLKLRGKVSGSVPSASGPPVPLVSGRPPPSSMVQLAAKKSRPWAMSSRTGIEYSWPSWR